MVDKTEERILIFEFISGYGLDVCIDQDPNVITEVIYRYNQWLEANDIMTRTDLSFDNIFYMFDRDMNITGEFCIDYEDFLEICLVGHLTAQALAK